MKKVQTLAKILSLFTLIFVICVFVVSPVALNAAVSCTASCAGSASVTCSGQGSCTATEDVGCVVIHNGVITDIKACPHAE
jgi:hypothetical protein